MDLSYRYSGKSVLIIDIDEASGSLVNGTIEDFIETMLTMDRKKSNMIALDMSRKKYLNSSGLGDLIMTKDRLFDQGVELVLIGVAGNIQSLLSMVGVEDFFKLAGNETATLTTLSATDLPAQEQAELTATTIEKTLCHDRLGDQAAHHASRSDDSNVRP